MKKKLIVFMLVLPLLLVGCNNNKLPTWEKYDNTKYSANVDAQGYTLIDIFALNDFHGALARDEEAKHPGISRLNTYLKNQRSNNPGGTIFLSSGDMWQGSADSNLTKGKIVTELMNYMGYEAMTIGNHEFDWSIAQIEANKEISDFPYLGSNIVDKDTKERAPFVDDSVIITRDGVNVGVIGVMGSDLEHSVQTSLLANYEFDAITSYVTEEAEELRSHGADIVVLAAHDTWVVSNLTPERQTLLDNKVIDAVLSGHQHVVDQHLKNGVPILQTRGYGRDVQHITFKYNKDTKDLKLGTYEVVKDLYTFDLPEDKTTKAIYDYHYKANDIAKIKNEVLATLVNKEMSRTSIANFTVQVMQEAYEGVIGAAHNVEGGIRVNSFSKGKLTYGLIYQAFPFDNDIYVVEMSGRRVKALMDYSGNLARYFTVDRDQIDDNATYKIATISYVYELDGSPFANLTYEQKFAYPRDLIASYLRNIKTLDGSKY